MIFSKLRIFCKRSIKMSIVPSPLSHLNSFRPDYSPEVLLEFRCLVLENVPPKQERNHLNQALSTSLGRVEKTVGCCWHLKTRRTTILSNNIYHYHTKNLHRTERLSFLRKTLLPTESNVEKVL